jgi:hypothetical protein
LLTPLVAVFLLKVRPMRQPVKALFLSDLFFTERKASTLRRCLRDFISLILLASAAVKLVPAAQWRSR